MAGFLNAFAALEQGDSLDSATTSIDDDDDVVVFTIVACFMRNNLNRSIGYFEWTIPSYLSREFQSHFRMTRQTFQLLLQEVIPTGRIPIENRFGRPKIPPEKQVLLFLWAMANQEPHRFDVTMSSAHRVIRRVTQAMLDILPRYIKWPTVREAHEIATSFLGEGGFPGVVGLIDGTYIKIRAPMHEPQAYINRKRTYSLNTQVVCDNNMVFLDVLAGWPGSVHDTRMLRNSGVYHTAATKFPADTHLLGDGGYPLLRWLIIPFRDNGRLTPRQRRFNTILSSVRQKVERSISLLKGRWRRLHFLDYLDLELAVKIVMATCVLHNFCLVNDDFDDDYFLPDGDDDGNHEHGDEPEGRADGAEAKRLHLMNIVAP